jgi:hypothetical protein
MVPGNGLLDESLVVGFAAADLLDFDDLRKQKSVSMTFGDPWEVQVGVHGVGVWALTYILVFVNRIDLLKGMMISRNLFLHRHPGGTITCIDSPFLEV